jgi:hypothetical protein
MPSAPSLARAFVFMLLLGTLLFGAGCRRRPESKGEPAWKKVPFQIGETTIRAHVTKSGRNGLTMIALHEDEQTSVGAGRKVLERYGGRLIELVHSGDRRVAFSRDGQAYSFDPNRIFSESGVAATVRGNGVVGAEIHREVNRFAQEFVDYFRLRKERCLIALHNNGEGGLAITTYGPGGSGANDAEKVFSSPAIDPDNFFYVTDDRFFRFLADRGLNVVLQNNRTVQDDGSMSVFAGRYGIPYINVETQEGQLREQIEMLDAAIEVCSAL